MKNNLQKCVVHDNRLRPYLTRTPSKVINNSSSNILTFIFQNLLESSRIFQKCLEARDPVETSSIFIFREIFLKVLRKNCPLFGALSRRSERSFHSSGTFGVSRMLAGKLFACNPRARERSSSAPAEDQQPPAGNSGRFLFRNFEAAVNNPPNEEITGAKCEEARTGLINICLPGVPRNPLLAPLQVIILAHLLASSGVRETDRSLICR